ncbi:YodC family protein [Aeromonas enteropelogenes]|uniref:YodC family protein n=1 Tax=Aeromonas enteropelogenes TaxID=29489 RepID=UPI003987022B
MKVGDVVKLHSGGPSMTILNVDEASAECLWFTSDYLLQRASFPLSVIEPIKKEIPYTRSGFPPL